MITSDEAHELEQSAMDQVIEIRKFLVKFLNDASYSVLGLKTQLNLLEREYKYILMKNGIEF